MDFFLDLNRPDTVQLQQKLMILLSKDNNRKFDFLIDMLCKERTPFDQACHELVEWLRTGVRSLLLLIKTKQSEGENNPFYSLSS